MDKDSNSYKVEMRGERTIEGIYFKTKHVGVVLNSDRFVDTIVNERKFYHETIDYVWFAIQNHASGGNLDRKTSDIPLQEQERKRIFNKKHEVFFTFSGLMFTSHDRQQQNSFASGCICKCSLWRMEA